MNQENNFNHNDFNNNQILNTNNNSMQANLSNNINSFQQPINNKPPKKVNLGLIIGGIGAAMIVGAAGLFLMMNNDGNKDDNGNILGGSSNNENSSVDLTIDESIPKSITCSLVGEAMYAKDTTYSYEYVLPNWNRYTFIKEYEPHYTEPGKTYVVLHYDKECKDNRKVDSAHVKTDDFDIYIHYSVSKYSSVVWKNIKERATDHLDYDDETLYGNDNGYWYGKMEKTEDGRDEFDVTVWKEMAKLQNAHTHYGNILGDEYHALKISISISYENETGKVRLNYLLNDLKEMLTEKYNLDLSELTVDMIKK